LPECEGGDRKRHLDEEDATLKLHYGNWPKIVRASLQSAKMGENDRRTPRQPIDGRGLCRRINPLGSFGHLTGISRANVVNIDHFWQK
jgi:hypothetical protein